MNKIYRILLSYGGGGGCVRGRKLIVFIISRWERVGGERWRELIDEKAEVEVGERWRERKEIK